MDGGYGIKFWNCVMILSDLIREYKTLRDTGQLTPLTEPVHHRIYFNEQHPRKYLINVHWAVYKELTISITQTKPKHVFRNHR